MIRVNGDVRRINLPPMEHKDVHAMVYDIMSDSQRKHYEENLECDFSFEIPNLARFRVNAFVQHRGAGAVFRTIPSKVLTLEELNCPKIFKDIAEYPRGIVLVTGPTGSGKSTTLAAMPGLRGEEKGDGASRHLPGRCPGESVGGGGLRPFRFFAPVKAGHHLELVEAAFQGPVVEGGLFPRLEPHALG